MTVTHTQVGPNRFREEFGRCYEDFAVGDIYEHRPGRTINEADNTWFTLLTMNQHPLHFDAEYAAGSAFGRLLVNSTLTLSIVTGMSVSDVSQRAIANLGWNDIRLPAPVFVGDTLYAESEVLSKRTSASRPNAGIVTVRTTGLKIDGPAGSPANSTAGGKAADSAVGGAAAGPAKTADGAVTGTVVITFERTILVPLRAHAGETR